MIYEKVHQNQNQNLDTKTLQTEPRSGVGSFAMHRQESDSDGQSDEKLPKIQISFERTNILPKRREVRHSDTRLKLESDDHVYQGCKGNKLKDCNFEALVLCYDCRDKMILIRRMAAKVI